MKPTMALLALITVACGGSSGGSSGLATPTAPTSPSPSRDQLRNKRSRLRSTLDQFVRGKETAKYLQEQVASPTSQVEGGQLFTYQNAVAFLPAGASGARVRTSRHLWVTGNRTK